MLNRRDLIKTGLGAGAGLALGRWGKWGSAYAFYQSPTTIPLFKTDLRGPGAIPVALWDGFDPLDPTKFTPAPVTGVKHYTLDINEFTDQIAPASSGLGPTKLWGYHPATKLGGGQAHLGGIIIGKKGEPIQLTFRNNLPTTHIIPNDLSIPGADQGNDRAAVHLHGGLVPWISDGGPHDWFNSTGAHGLSFLNNQVLNPAAIGTNSAEYYWGLNQSARFMWYHDHAWGITRINAYAGVATGLLLRDDFEIGLKNKGLPEFIENSVIGRTLVQELPLVFQDKIFVGPGPLPGTTILAVDPTWTGPTAPGSLWYAHTYERNRWRLSGNASGGNAKNLPLPDPSVVAEFFGDTMLVNGTAFPTVKVEPRRYRLRLLDACNARFLNLQLYLEDPASLNGITLNPATGNPINSPALCDPNAPGTSATILQIGTEGGFLPKPVKIPTNLPFNPVTLTGSLLVAPAERPDILVDFSAHKGKNIILYNDAPAPFPVGDPRNDYFPGFNVKGNPVNALTPAGFGPNSRVLMRFEVGTTTSGNPDSALAIDTNTDLSGGIDPLTLVPDKPNRQLTLNETFDPYGRLIQLLGTTVPLASPSAGFGRAYMDPSTENVVAGSTEIWEIFNATGDVHPMHFHLVNVMVLNRQAFQVSSLGSTKGGANFTGPITPPAPNEMGWKETVPMYPGTVTRVIMRFDLPLITDKFGNPITTTPLPGSTQLPITAGMPPVSPRTGITGHEYVWHCHILEHEEHDMMRPLVVA